VAKYYWNKVDRFLVWLLTILTFVVTYTAVDIQIPFDNNNIAYQWLAVFIALAITIPVFLVLVNKSSRRR
jgi:hypothetical protein